MFDIVQVRHLINIFQLYFIVQSNVEEIGMCELLILGFRHCSGMVWSHYFFGSMKVHFLSPSLPNTRTYTRSEISLFLKLTFHNLLAKSSQLSKPTLKSRWCTVYNPLILSLSHTHTYTHVRTHTYTHVYTDTFTRANTNYHHSHHQLGRHMRRWWRTTPCISNVDYAPLVRDRKPLRHHPSDVMRLVDKFLF